MVLLVLAQVFGEIVDPRGQQRDLDTGVPRVGLVGAELGDDLLFAFARNGPFIIIGLVRFTR